MVRTVLGSLASGLRLLGGSRLALWIVFVLAHLVLGLIDLYSTSNPIGDVRFVYTFWVDEALSAHYWVGIDGPWVYPVLAILPMLAARAFGPDLYASTWLSMIMLLDAVALAVLTGWGRKARNLGAGWWWVGFVALLGPIALGRIDSVTVPIALIGVVIVARRPRVATALFTLAAWVKVWPAALVASLVISARKRFAVLAAAVATSAVVVVVPLVLGAGWNVLSFVGEQTGRGLQVEAPVSSIWLWRGVAGVPGVFVYYDRDILTFQVAGRGVDVASALMNPIMAAGVVVVVALAARALARGRRSVELFPMLSLGLVSALIVFNKVGSPQYIGWLAVPVVAAIVTGGAARATMRGPAVLVLLAAALTQVVYPYFYTDLVTLQPWMVVVVTARNLLLVGVYVAVLVELTALGRRAVAWRQPLTEHDRLEGAPGPKDPVL